MMTEREQALDQLQQTLTRIKTATSIKVALMDLLRHGMDASSIDLNDYDHQNTRRAAHQQLLVGTTELWKGRLARRWIDAQTEAFQNYAPWNDGATWARRVTQAIWNTIYTIWAKRNAILHETQSWHQTQNIEQVDQHTREEWMAGFDDLPAEDQHLVKELTVEGTLALDPLERRMWLGAIQLARTWNASIPSREHENLSETADSDEEYQNNQSE